MRIKLVKSVRMTPQSSGLELVQLDNSEVDGLLLLEQTSYFDKTGHDGLLLGETLVSKDANGFVTYRHHSKIRRRRDVLVRWN